MTQKTMYLVSIIIPLLASSLVSSDINPEHLKTKYQYAPKEFSIVMSDDEKFSDQQLNDHLTLYKGYVSRRNEIKSELASIAKNTTNTTYSLFRNLKIAEIFARNGSLLHELYFENIKSSTHIGPHTYNLIKQSFDSIEAFKTDLFACALCARGWVVTGYNIEDKTIHNYILDSHSELIPILVLPLIVIDTYEHAYMIDFGINRLQYIQIIWNNINWDIVEERTQNYILV